MLNIYIYIYTEYTSYIQYMLVYWREVSVVVSMNSPKVPLHISLLWNSDGRLAVRQTHFEYDNVEEKKSSSIPDGIVLSF